MAVPTGGSIDDANLLHYKGLLGSVLGVVLVDAEGGLVVSGIAGADTGNAASVAAARKEVNFTTTTAQAVGTTDAGAYRWVSIQITSQGTSSVVNFQQSNDNINWVSVNLFSTAAAAQAAPNTSSTGLFFGPLQARWFRLNVTGIAAGTTAGVVELTSLPTTTHSEMAQVAGLAAEAAAASGNPVRIGGWDGSLIRTARTDTSGNLQVASSVATPATPLTATSDVAANAAGSVSLAAAAGATTRLWALHITTNSTPATQANALGSVAGPTTAFNFRYQQAASGNSTLIIAFPYPIPASAVNTAITVSIPALGVNSVAYTITAFGDRV